MINIKVFYKKVYNHLDIYTNTQIYIHIYMYILFYNMAIEKSFNYVSNHLIINHIELERRGVEMVIIKASGCFAPPHN